MSFLVTATAPVGAISKTHFTVGEAQAQALSLYDRGFRDVAIRDPQGRSYTPETFARAFGLRPAA